MLIGGLSDRKVILDYAGRPSVIIRILINEREGRRVRRHGSKGSRGQSDVTAASGDGRKPQTKECGQSLEVEIGRGTNSALEPSRRNAGLTP